ECHGQPIVRTLIGGIELATQPNTSQPILPDDRTISRVARTSGHAMAGNRKYRAGMPIDHLATLQLAEPSLASVQNLTRSIQRDSNLHYVFENCFRLPLAGYPGQAHQHGIRRRAGAGRSDRRYKNIACNPGNSGCSGPIEYLLKLSLVYTMQSK